MNTTRPHGGPGNDDVRVDFYRRSVRKSKYSADVLRPLVATKSSLSEVIRSLGLRPNGGNHRMIATRIRLAGLDTAHFTPSTHREQVARVPLETLETLVRRSRSVAAVLTELGLPPDGRSHREMSRRIRELALDVSHFKEPVGLEA